MKLDAGHVVGIVLILISCVASVISRNTTGATEAWALLIWLVTFVFGWLIFLVGFGKN